MERSLVTLRCFSKINLGLQVVGVRPDGYHELRTILQIVDLHDTLEASRADRGFTLRVRGEWADGADLALPADESNLVLKAARALQERLEGRGAAFTLTKRIPAGAGLGGASADAAAALLALDRLHGLRMEPIELHRAAASIGTDVPFFLYGGACLALGRGDEIYPLPDGPDLHLVLAFPGQGLGTAEVYREWDRLLTSAGKACRVSDFAPWCLVLRGAAPSVANDLEPVAAGLLPSLGELRARLEGAGATAVSMTGSGSAFFGVFSGAAAAARAARRLRECRVAAVAAKSLARAEWERLVWTKSRTGTPT